MKNRLAKFGSKTAQRLLEANRVSFDIATASPDLGEGALAAARSEAAESLARLRAIEASTSWRLTRPIRWVLEKMRRQRHVTPPNVADQPSARPIPGPRCYEDWIVMEEAKCFAALARSRPGRQAILPQRLGLVLFATKGCGPVLTILLKECPSECTILLLGQDGELPPVAAVQGSLLRGQVPQGFSPADAVGLALQRLNTDMLCFLDGRDQLAPGALSLVADTLARHPQLDLLFADEDWLDADGRRTRPFFKPGWDAELQRGRDLVGPFAFFRTALVRAATPSFGPAWLYDLTNQVAAATRPERIHHIPAVLCHRSVTPSGHAEAMWAAAAAQLRRENIAARIDPMPDYPGWQRIVYDLPQPEPLVSIIVPTRDRGDLLRVCAEGVLNRTTYPRLEVVIVDNGTVEPDAVALLNTLVENDRVQVLRMPGAFNWSALNNAGARQATGDVLVLLNNDIKVLQPGWLTTLISYAMQPGVGGVGAKLLYPDGRVQHAGLTTNQGIPSHLFRCAPGDESGAFGLMALAREVWGVTGACLAIRRDVFFGIGGLNEALPVAYNDVDLCMRLTAHGYRIVWTPWSLIEHQEQASRPPDHVDGRRDEAREELHRLLRDWGTLALHDPFLNPNLYLVDEQLCFRGSPTALAIPLTQSTDPGPIKTGPTLAAGGTEKVAAAQARRDRDRLAAMQAEITSLRYRLAELENSRPRRALAAARWAARAIAPALRSSNYLLRIVPAAEIGPPVAAARRLALVIDDNWPQPDRDAGSVEIINLLNALERLDYHVVLAAAKQHIGEQPVRGRLARQGIRCLQPSDAASVEQFIVDRGSTIDLCVLCRVFCGGEFLELAQQHCGKARLVFDSIDLNFLREERKARLLGDAAMLTTVQQARAREEHIIQSCDATMVVSQAELELLAKTRSDCLAVQMPLARAVQRPATPFGSRHGIGFIGGFSHAPNEDAVRTFLAEIWPLVCRELPECELSIVGPDVPPDLVAGCADSVHVLGHVPDIGPWFESLRLTVAPLRFGAGSKGKVASSLAAGVPCVATPIAAEGMSLPEEGGVLIATNPAEFAAAIVRAYRDEALWSRLSAAGVAYAERELSLPAWQDRLQGMLQRIGL